MSPLNTPKTRMKGYSRHQKQTKGKIKLVQG